MKKSKKVLLIILISILAVIMIALMVISIFLGINYFKKDSIEIKSTTVNTKGMDGVYITDVSDIVEEAMPSIVSITSKTLIQSGYYGPFSYGDNASQYVEGAGSGIIISDNDNEILILTNNHVVADSSELTVEFINGKEVDATVKGTSERKDIAVISVKKSNCDTDTLNAIKIATVGDSSALQVGDGIIAIGNALGYGQSVTTGVVSALDREVTIDDTTNKMIQIDAAINGGNSGGALLNSAGEVVGINSAKYSSSGSSSSASIEGMGFAIPISDVKDLINSLMNGESDESSITLGIEGYMTTSSALANYNFPEGFYISAIETGSYAASSELEIGDIITAIDGNTVESVNDIKNVLYDKKTGDSVELTIKYVKERSYKEKTITINFK